MSVSVATPAAGVPLTFSIGPVKVQFFDVPIISGDTSVTVTADRMSKVLFGMLCSSAVQTSAASFATNVATFTITDPVATIKGQALVIGV